MSEEIKTRSKMFLSKMSDDVQIKVEQVAKDMCISKWLVIEQILENAFGITNEKIDVQKWLKGNHSQQKVGKPNKTRKR